MTYKRALGNGKYCYTRDCKKHTPGHYIRTHLKPFNEERIIKNAGITGMNLDLRLLRDGFDRLNYRAKLIRAASDVEQIRAADFSNWHSTLLKYKKHHLDIDGEDKTITLLQTTKDPKTLTITSLISVDYKDYVLTAEYSGKIELPLVGSEDIYTFSRVSNGLTDALSDPSTGQ